VPGAPESYRISDPCKKLPSKFLGQYLCFSRLPDQPKIYVQDAIRRERESELVGSLLKSSSTHIVHLQAERGWKAALRKRLPTCAALSRWTRHRFEIPCSRKEIETYCVWSLV
jgi:hypothetical protein